MKIKLLQEWSSINKDKPQLASIIIGLFTAFCGVLLGLGRDSIVIVGLIAYFGYINLLSNQERWVRL